jgi:hypothetical protein
MTMHAEQPQTCWASRPGSIRPYTGPPRNLASIDAVKFDKRLQPKSYEIAGTSPSSKILLLDVNILDSTGMEPYLGDVFIEGMYFLSCKSVCFPTWKSKDKSIKFLFAILISFVKNS